VVALTAIVVASVTLMIHKQQDNALLLQRIDSLNTENAALREQVRQFTSARGTKPYQKLTQPAGGDPVPAGEGLSSDS